MTFASLLDVCRRAQAQGYAIPAFNVVDLNTTRAVVQAACDAGSPVIVQPSVKTVRYWGASTITAGVKTVAGECDTPVVLHLDHCPDPELAREVIDAGWSSVLIDVSSYSDDDEARTIGNTISTYAHDRGATVEIEYENIIGVEDGVGSDEILRSSTVEELLEFMAYTGADVLAPQLGTAHGEYKKAPQLLPERAQQLTDQGDFPIVLHGGTGLTNDQFRAFIDAGVSKINISTALKLAYMKDALEFLKSTEAANKWEPLDLIGAQFTAVKKMAEEHIDVFRNQEK